MLAKRAELSTLIHEHQPDIIFGTETWLLPNINSTEFFPTGYTLFRQDRSDGYGGVLLAFRKDLSVIEYQITNLNQCEIIACTVVNNTYSLALCNAVATRLYSRSWLLSNSIDPNKKPEHIRYLPY